MSVLVLRQPCEHCLGRGHDDSRFCPAGGWEFLAWDSDAPRCHPCDRCFGTGISDETVLDPNKVLNRPAHKRLDHDGKFAYTITVDGPGRYLVVRLDADVVAALEEET